MAAKKPKKSAITGLSRPEGFIDDWAREGIKAVTKAGRQVTKATRSGRNQRRHITRNVLEMRAAARDVVPRAERHARMAAEQLHLNKQYDKVKGKGANKVKGAYELRATVNDLRLGDEPLNELSRNVADRIGIKQKGFNKAYAAERAKAAQKYSTARKTANRKKGAK
jgi:hypothetical protein